MSELAGYTEKELIKKLEDRGYTVIDDDVGYSVSCEEIVYHIKSRYDQVHLWIQSIRCGETTIEGFYADQVKEMIYDMTNSTVL